MIFPIKYNWMWNYWLPSSVSVLSIWAKNCGWDLTMMILWLLAYTDQLADIPEYILSNMLEYILWTYIKGYIISMKSSCKVKMKKSVMPVYLSTLKKNGFVKILSYAFLSVIYSIIIFLFHSCSINYLTLIFNNMRNLTFTA